MVVSRKRLNFFNLFHSIYHFKAMKYGTLLAYITVSVQSDVILLDLQQNLFRDGLHSSSSLWMSRASSGVCRLYHCVCVH